MGRSCAAQKSLFGLFCVVLNFDGPSDLRTKSKLERLSKPLFKQIEIQYGGSGQILKTNMCQIQDAVGLGFFPFIHVFELARFSAHVMVQLMLPIHT